MPVDKAETINLGVDIDLRELAAGHSSGTRSPKLRASVIIDCNAFPWRITSRSQSKLIADDIIEKAPAKAKATS